jgi:hypothetical protein
MDTTEAEADGALAYEVVGVVTGGLEILRS